MKRAVLFAFLLLCGCTPTYDSAVGADGRIYYSYNCVEFEDCMYGVRDKCPGRYDVFDRVALPLITGKAPAQLYFKGSQSLDDGGRIVFSCEQSRQHLTAELIQDEIEQLQSELEN